MEPLSRIARKTKNRILETALTLFKERGYDPVTIDEITQTAGVAKGTFYTYFTTKSDIIVEEFWKIDAFYESFSTNKLRNYKTAEDKLLAFTRAQMHYVRDMVGNKNLRILYANQAVTGSSDKMITNENRQWHIIIRDVIKEGQANGEFRMDMDAERLAVLFNRHARGIFLDWCVEGASFDLVKEGVSAMKNFVIPALRLSVKV